MPFKTSYLRKEEFWNVLTHGLGALFSVAGLILLIYFSAQSGTALDVVCATVFGVSMLLLYRFYALPCSGG